MYSFTHVDAFYQVARFVNKANKTPEIPHEFHGPINFVGTTKLHGTNSSVCFDVASRALTVQSRTREITPLMDNAGFAAFIESNKNKILEIFDNLLKNNKDLSNKEKIIIYGEWIGPGIQKGVGINQLPKKQWVVFALKVTSGEKTTYIDNLPKFGDKYKEENIYSILDGPVWNLSVDFEDLLSKERAILAFEKYVDEVEKECPWAKQFGISGIGEGIVWQPTGVHFGNSDLFFKTKGAKHKVSNSKTKKESINPEVLKNMEDFISFALTENRLNQGFDFLKENNISIDEKSTGHYLKWIGNDVQRECRLELEDNNLDWKQVSKMINQKAKNFFFERLKNE